MDHFDMDGNGKIDSYEFICAMTMLSHATLEEKAELVFNLYDFDGSKYISHDELVILMTNSLTALKSMQKKPAPSIQEIEHKTNEFFMKSDVDQDQKITLQEFKNYITQDKQILEVLINANVAKKDDLGMDFGSGGSGVPDIDKDLENECNPKELNQKKANMKEGIGFVQKQDDAGGLFEAVEMGEGDQFMAVKPWIGVIKNSVPSNYKPNRRDGEAPDAQLQLEHIFGYRCHDVRNNLRYTASGNLVYHAAAAGIVHDPKTNTQKFLLEHNDDIHCLAIDPSGKYCATGQIGPKPWLLVWDNESMQCVSRIQGHLLKGVMQVAFSNDGKKIAASAMDDDHSVAIYDWQAPLKPGQPMKPLAFGKGTRANILSLGFNPDATKVVATCVKEVNFFTYAGGVLKGQKGVGWGTAGATSVPCQAFIDNTLYTGTFKGEIVAWNDRSISGKPIKAHESCVNTMITRTKVKGIISGGNDGKVILWKFAGSLQQERTFDLAQQEVRSLIPKVRSVCENSTNGLILVGTRGGEIVEFGATKPVVHMRSHCDGELWGLAPHPTKNEFVTIGQDNMLAIWDVGLRRQKKFARLDCAGNVLAYTSDGAKLAIGYTNGSLTVLDQNFQVIVIRKDRKKAIQEIKFSPDNAICAVGAHDSLIFTYDAKNNFKPMKKLRGHHSTIQHIDFALDGQALMSNCTSYEILFFNTSTGKQVTGGASAYKNETWSSWTCTLGWPVQGIFPPCADGSDINSCDRSPDQTILATGDDFGMVKLFRYPCPVDEASFTQYIGHSSHVTNVRFLPKSPYLISTGGEDKSIFQWRYSVDKESQQESQKTKQTRLAPDQVNEDMEDAGDDLFQEDIVGEGDQRLAVDPFKGEIFAPSGYQQTSDAGNTPNGNLRLKYAHGFRSFDTRSNLKYTSSGEVAFTTAALGVVLNKQQNTQKFFNYHEDDVVAMAIHPSRDIIATGQMAAKGKAKVVDIFVWNASTMENIAQINGFHRRAVRNLAFSPNGEKLLSVGEDDFHSVAVYDWANKRMLSNSKVDPDKVFDATWKDENEFMTVGMKHVKFFTAQGQNLTGGKGLYGSIGPTPMICCSYVFDSKTAMTGTPKGGVVQWSGRTVGKVLKGHTDAVWQILTVMGGTHMLTGGNDCKLILWDKTFAQKKMVDLNPMSKCQPGVRSLDYSEQAKTVIVGTRGSEIIEVDLMKGTKIKTLIYGHYEGTKQAELWGCAVHPSEQIFASCGADQRIRLWTEKDMVACSEPFPSDLTAIDWAQSGSFFVVGDRNGIAHLVNAQSLQALSQIPSTNANKKNAWVQDLKIAPNSQLMAFGTHGGRSKIEIVKILENGKKMQKAASIDVQITSSLTHLDWTLDSTKVVINSQAYELMWLDVHSKQRTYGSGAKDFEYASWTCILGWPVQGIFPGADYTDVNCTCRSNSRQILATADDFGTVKLFKFPCVVDKASFKSYMGHSSHVTRVKFSKDDKFLISTGGNDKTVLIWETDFSMDDPSAQAMIQGGEAEPQYDDDDDGFSVNMVDKSKEDKQKMKVELKKSQKKVSSQAAVEDDFFQVEDVGEGDEFMAVKPWIGQMKEPSGFQKAPVNQDHAPAIKLELDWVHGYRCRDAKNNLTFLQDGSIAYHAAGLGICLDIGENQQRYFNLHTDDVTAIAYSPDKRTIATGELGRKPAIYIYDGFTMGMTYKFQGKLQNGIQALAFSPSGKLLAGVAMDDNHSVAVYNAETGAFVAMTNGDKAQILELAFKNETEFYSAGVKHFMIWTVGAQLRSQRGNFGKSDQRIGSCCVSGDSCLTGSITGELYIWGGASMRSKKKLHDLPLDAIFSNQQYVMTGGRDCKVNVLSKTTFDPLFTFLVESPKFNTISGRVRALALNEHNNQLLVGTFGSEIYHMNIDMNAKSIGQPRILVQGHYSPLRKDNNEVWGLISFPKKDMYATCSDDGTLRVWDTATRKQTRLIKLTQDHQGKDLPMDASTGEHSHGCQGRCADISPDEQYCVIGFRDGSIRVYNIRQDWQFSAKKVPSKRWIGDVKFSPCGKMVAAASHDCKIYVFNFPKLDLKCTLKSSTAFVTHIDWSLDSNSIHSNDASYEILYYNAQTGRQDTGGASSMRDEHWATWTLILGWPVQGIWPPAVDGTDINATDRSRQPHQDGYHLIATADDFSKVKVFRYPSIKDDSKFVEGRGHSSHVTQVKFSKDDRYLYSAGGNDTCIFQWRVEK